MGFKNECSFVNIAILPAAHESHESQRNSHHRLLEYPTKYAIMSHISKNYFQKMLELHRPVV